MTRLENEKKELDKRINDAIKQVSNSNQYTDNQFLKMFSYHNVSDGIEIDSFDTFEDVTELFIPDKIDNIPVVSIAREAFSKLAIKSVILPDSLIKIGAFSFMDCSSLSNVALPDNLEIIETAAFNGTDIEKISIPEKVVSLPRACFCRCKKLKEIILNEGLKTIESAAFSDTRIDKIVLPRSLESFDMEFLDGSLAGNISHKKIVVLGENTSIISSKNHLFYEKVVRPYYTFYCLQGSVLQKECRLKGLKCYQLSDYYKDK